jgi:hypothetical protein
MDEDTARKLQELLDRSEIWRVIQTYGRALDRLDVELARSCYHDDAVDDHNSFVGPRDAFIEWANATTRLFVNSQHCVHNHYCELDGNEAHTETYYSFWGEREDPPHLGSAGRYIDHFRKRDGVWRIANRVATVEKSFDLFDSSLFPSVPMPARGPEEQTVARDRSDVSYHRPIKVRAPRG